jgi:hypothetical protein
LGRVFWHDGWTIVQPSAKGNFFPKIVTPVVVRDFSMATKSTLRAILTDTQFWVPVIALAFGILLLAIFH